MCLVVKKVEKLIAKKDLVFYKVLEKSPGGKFYTPYRSKNVELNKLIVDKEDLFFYDDGSKYYAHGGLIHLCKTKFGAKRLVKDINRGNFVIVKAIVSKGTEYYVGKHCFNKFPIKSIGTKAVRYEEITNKTHRFFW